jgi:DNA polymerase III delta subunit
MNLAMVNSRACHTLTLAKGIFCEVHRSLRPGRVTDRFTTRGKNLGAQALRQFVIRVNQGLVVVHVEIVSLARLAVKHLVFLDRVHKIVFTPTDVSRSGSYLCAFQRRQLFIRCYL